MVSEIGLEKWKKSRTSNGSRKVIPFIQGLNFQLTDSCGIFYLSAAPKLSSFFVLYALVYELNQQSFEGPYKDE